ncbi:MAG: hypothetical protein OEZ10_01965 [Gammaproteobacteria bacterium]|nr:hypothetical protein [Gammaproteobacteria bacterium]
MTVINHHARLAAPMLLALLLLSGPAANAAGVTYVGPKLGIMSVDVACPGGVSGDCASQGLGAGFIAGYNLFGKNAGIPVNLAGGTVAIEVDFTWGLTELSSDSSGGGFTYSSTWKENMQGAFVAFRYPFTSSFFVQARAGGGNREVVGEYVVTEQATGISTTTDVREGKSVSAYGVSAGLDFGGGQLRFDVLQFQHDNASSTTDTIGLSYTFSF